MNWEVHAQALADRATHRHSRWAAPLAAVPRHLFVPRWWERDPDGAWALRNGEADPDSWFREAYSDTSLVTRVGRLHADDAADDARPPEGRPTSSATLPSLLVRMYQHALIDDADTVCDVGTGSGYGTALLARRLTSRQVVSLDVDPYLVDAARTRLETVGLTPRVAHADATGPLPVDPGSVDRLVATVAVGPPIPPSWLDALCVGGRLVTVLAGTSLLVTAERTDDGGALGRVAWDRAGFMPARHGPNHPPGAGTLLAEAAVGDGEDVSLGPYPVVDVENAWDLACMVALKAPGVEHAYREDDDGRRTALMAHPDGSWARATAAGDQRPTVHQSGPRRLWDLLDECRAYWLTHGELPVRGARVIVRPDGTTVLARGRWHHKVETR